VKTTGGRNPRASSSLPRATAEVHRTLGSLRPPAIPSRSVEANTNAPCTSPCQGPGPVLAWGIDHIQAPLPQQQHAKDCYSATEPLLLFSVISDARPWARGSVSTFVSSGGLFTFVLNQVP